MSRLQRLCLGAGLLLALTQCQTAEPIPDIAGYYERSCWFSGSAARQARCGWLVVAENRSRSDSRAIRLPVVIFAPREGASGSEPLLYISGGPGSRARIGNQREIDGWLRRIDEFPPRNEVIVLGLRGTGRERPDLYCPSLTDPRIWAGAGANPPPWDLRQKRLAEETAACRDKLLAAGIDLAAYNSREAAADIAELRRRLGIERWSLYGISYGTRIALTVLRHHPEGVRSVVLDSVFPPEALLGVEDARFLEASLKRLFEDCRESDACRQSHPDIEAKFWALVEKLRTEPVEIRLGGSQSWPPMPITVDDRIFLSIVFNALYWRPQMEALPRTVESALAGDFGLLERQAESYIHRDDPAVFSPAVMLSFLCHEEAAFVTAEQRAAALREAGRFGAILEEDWVQRLCDQWPAGKAEAVENEPVVSDVPALLLTGSYDPITPPVLARRAAAGLERSHVVEIGNVGHAVLRSHSCAADVLAAFLADPFQSPEPACLERIGLPEFADREDDPQ